MKIVYLTSFFPPDRFAGAELGTEFMAEHMAKLGHEVHVIISRPKTNLERTEKRKGFTIHWLPYIDAPFLRFLSEIRAGFRKIKSLKPDLVQANCLLPGGYTATKASRQLGIPSIVLCYGYDVCDIKFPLTLAGKHSIQHCTQLLSATKYCRGIVQDLVPQSQAQVFYAGYDGPAFPLLDFRPPDQDKVQLIFMGRMIPEKGFDLMIKIMKELPETFHLKVVGDGLMRKQYEQDIHQAQLQERVQFLGQVRNDQIKEIFKSCDTLVLPSLREPFGVVCIEAIASGLPVVCSKVMGLPEAVTDQRNGCVIESRDPKVWSQAIQSVTLDEQRKRDLYEAAKEDRIKWMWETRLAELENVYRDIV